MKKEMKDCPNEYLTPFMRRLLGLEASKNKTQKQKVTAEMKKKANRKGLDKNLNLLLLFGLNEGWFK